jgi:hypothetical protein
MRQTRSCGRIRRIFLCCVWLSGMSLPLAAQTATADATHDIIVTREQVTDRVVDLKKKFKESDPEWREARDKYRKAYAEFTAYIATMKAAIRKGKTEDLAKNASYKKAAEDASGAANAFIKYADSKTTGTTRGFFLIGPLFAQGLSIFNAYKDAQAERRAQEADAFEREVRWRRWEEIK